MSGPTLENHWHMVERCDDKLDFDAAVAHAGWMISLNPLPFEYRRKRVEDAQGNEVFVGEDSEMLHCVNAMPLLLLEVRRLREALEGIREDLDGMPCSGPCDSYGVCRICTARSATHSFATPQAEAGNTMAVKPPRWSDFTLLFARPEHLPSGVDFRALLRVVYVDFQKGEIRLHEEREKR